MLRRIGSAAGLLLVAATAWAAPEGENGNPIAIDFATRTAVVDGERRCVVQATLRSAPGTRFPGATLEPLPVIDHHGTLEFEAADAGGSWVAWMPVGTSSDCAGAPRVTGARLVECGTEPTGRCAQEISATASERPVTLDVATHAGPEPSPDEGAAIMVRSWRRYLVVAFPGQPPERNFRVCEELTDLRNTAGQDIVGLSITRAGGAGDTTDEIVLDEPVPEGAAAILEQRLVTVQDCGEAPPPKPISVSRCRLADGTDCAGSVEAFHVGRD